MQMKALQAFGMLPAFSWIHKKIHEAPQPGDIVQSLLKFKPAVCQVQIISITNKLICSGLTFRRRIKSCMPFAGIIRRLSYSTHFQDKG